MMLGLSLPAFTLLHVVISLVALAAGLSLALGLIGGRHPGWLAASFLITTIATSVTGFMFPATVLLPSHLVGFVSLLALALAVMALWWRRLAGLWRGVYVVSALAALYLNAFVATVQAFLKSPSLQAMAPTQTEPPFVIAQAALLVVFVLIGWAALRGFGTRGRA